MLTRESYKMLLQNIVDTHLADESISFGLEGDQMVDSIFEREWEGHKDGHADQFGFADLATIKPVLDIALVAFSSFKVLTELRLLLAKNKEKEKIDADSLQRQWAKRLREAGIKSAKADAIASEFTHNLLKLAAD